MKSSALTSADFFTPATTISKSVDEVNLAFTVTDKRGRFISNLSPNDFVLRDKDQRPERFTFFQQRSDLPLHIAVLIDASSSVEYRFKFETRAAAEFLKNTLHQGRDQAVIIDFNDQVKIAAGPTDNVRKMAAALKKLKPGGDTALHDAVIYACKQLRNIPESQITRRAIILISDGVDTVNRSTLVQAEQQAARTEVMIFSLTTNRYEESLNGEGDKVLRELADSTGGALLNANDEMHLDSAFRNVQKALHNQYVLAYTPPAFIADGSFHRVELKALKHGLRTNCRRGYYARPAMQP